MALLKRAFPDQALALPIGPLGVLFGNSRDLAAGLDRLVAPAMQQAKQPFCTRLQLLARLALNAGKHTGNQPARLAHLDDGNDCAILVQGDEGPAQVVWLGHRGTPSVDAATMVPSPRRLPHSISRSSLSGRRGPLQIRRGPGSSLPADLSRK